MPDNHSVKRKAAMDWRLALEAERAAMQRIVALLFALADLAERAAGRSRPVRRLVLWILLPAEAVARELVTGPGMLPPLRRAGASPADALRLAASLRSLAAAFRDMSRQALTCANDTSGSAGGRAAFPITLRPCDIFARTLAEASATTLKPWKPYDTS